MTPRRPPWWVRLRLHLDSLDRYHAGAVLVLMAGVLGGLLIAARVGPLWAWAGFFAGALPMFLFVALAYSLPD
jgi:hypothetical protein